MRSRIAVFATILALSSTACTALGALIGSQIKSPSKDMRTAPVTELSQVKVGHAVVLHLKDGRVLSGKFGGVGVRDTDEYARAYAVARDEHREGPGLPVLGPVTILLTGGKKEEGVLVGLDLGGVAFRSSRGTLDRLTFPAISALSDSTSTISGDALERLALSVGVPLLGEVRMEEPPQRVHLDAVAQVEVPVLKGHAGVGALVGLAVDAVVVAMAVASMNDSWGDTPSCRTSDPNCTSCPLISSFDGHEWREEAEVLGSALLESAQRGDSARLEHLATIDGTYRLKIANTMAEVDFVDSLRLLVVDAEPGVRALPGPAGALLSVSNPRPPSRAVDRRGATFTPQLGESDGRVWFSNGFGRDPHQPADLKDGLVVEFERPPAANEVTLIFDVRSTPWAAHMLTRLLALQGPHLEAWRARMNSDREARAAFLTALAREGLPAIQIWDGCKWRPLGVLINLGPALSRQQAMRVDLRGIAGEMLRVRFDATPGFWIVDSILADFSPARPLHVTPLEPSGARVRSEDVRAALQSADGVRLRLDRGDAADLVFDAPPSRPGLERSFVVETTGYYTALVPERGAPDLALFERLVSDPQAFARFNLEELAADLHQAQRLAAVAAR